MPRNYLAKSNVDANLGTILQNITSIIAPGYHAEIYPPPNNNPLPERPIGKIKLFIFSIQSFLSYNLTQ